MESSSYFPHLPEPADCPPAICQAWRTGWLRSAQPNSHRGQGLSRHDGTFISLARLAGIKTGLITKRISETVALRARDLKLEHIHQGVQDKRTCLEKVLRGEGLKSEEAAFVGDDVIDLPPMRACGLAIAVNNARAEVKTPHEGGDGALRDAAEYILKAGKWNSVVDEYIGERRPKGRS